MKKIFVICLLCFGITAMSYGQAVVSIDPAEVASPAAGGTLSVNIKITNGTGVAGYNVTVGFDTSALQYVELKNATYLPTGAFAAPAQVSGNRVTLAATSLSGAASATSGTLATLTFKVVTAKASTIELVEVILSDSAANPLAVTKRNGEVVVRASLPTDLNNDGTVNVLDLTLVARDLGKAGGSPAGDVTGDGAVNVLDLVRVAQDLGKTTTPGGGTIGGGGTTVIEQPPAEEPSPPESMVLIPAGEFNMGSNDAEADNDEQPVRRVYVDAFYMDETEVTNVQYKEFLLENPQWQKGRANPKFSGGDYLKLWNGNNYPEGKASHPVVYVGWYAMMAYSEWANKRLPTEAEWEYAARGGLESKKYPNGNTITARDANFGIELNKGNSGKSLTTPVGKYPANGYGLYDMAGNVNELCLDQYDAEFYFTFPRNGVARNPVSGANSIQWILDNWRSLYVHRIGRGGGWYTKSPRVALRFPNSKENGGRALGFRCVKDVTD